MKGLSEMLKRIVFFLAVLSSSPQAMSSPGGGLFGSTEFTQISNNIELVAMYAQDAENLVTSIKQYETMLKNIENIGDFDRIKSLIQGDMEELATIVQKGEALAYSSGNIEEAFSEQNKGYEHYKQALDNNTPIDFQQVYSDWSQKNMDSILGGLKAAELQNSRMGEEHDLMAQVQAKLETSTGALQATQAAGAIAAQQVSQLQKLRGLLMAQMQSQTAYQSSQLERQAIKDAGAAKFTTTTTTAPQFNNPNLNDSTADLLDWLN
ncbi:MAG: P-type conjugative transfer protein TrbJ [Marinomonas sp.]